ncbi:hypothetical protein [Microcoleus sp. herbarium14]|uniref:hypothetical protein n=1 Tax=Microcoleus sp. herbarium14 TaxID=3055439 RepID=UPI002FD4763D
MDVSTANWYSNLGTTIQAAFNTSAMTNLTPSQIVFGAAVAYRKAQENYNNGTSVDTGAYINFASPLVEDVAPSLDSAGFISKNSAITLRVKTVYLPIAKIQPQQSITII